MQVRLFWKKNWLTNKKVNCFNRTLYNQSNLEHFPTFFNQNKAVNKSCRTEKIDWALLVIRKILSTHIYYPLIYETMKAPTLNIRIHKKGIELLIN